MATISAIIVMFILGMSEPTQDREQPLRHVKSIGAFERATRLVVSGIRQFIVIDREVNGVVAINERTGEKRVIGGLGWGETTFDEPTGAASDGLNFYVADRGNHRVQRFDRNFTLIATLTTRDTALPGARFGYPLDLALSRHGDILILDGENIRVSMFSGGSFSFIRSFGDLEAGVRMLTDPQKVAVSADDRIYVLERDRIAAFDYFGGYSGSIGKGILTGARGFALTDAGFVAVSDDSIWCFTMEGAIHWKAARKNILTDPALEPFRDVAWSGGSLFVLTSSRIAELEILR